MIGYLNGLILHQADGEVLLDVGGVGYRVGVHPRLEENLPADGEPLALFVHTLVREDALELYGFEALAERELFGTLLKVSGIGPRLGLALLATYELDELTSIVESGDARSLSKVPGIGPRTAEKLLVEMKAPLARLGKSGGGRSGQAAIPGTAFGDASLALGTLGFKRGEIDAVLSELRREKFSGDLAALVREALRRLRA